MRPCARAFPAQPDTRRRTQNTKPEPGDGVAWAQMNGALGLGRPHHPGVPRPWPLFSPQELVWRLRWGVTSSG